MTVQQGLQTFLYVVFLCVSEVAFAVSGEGEAVAEPVSGVVSGSGAGAISGPIDAAYMFQVIGSLLLVLGCIFAALLLLKKFNGIPGTASLPVRVIGSIRIGTREKIMLLETGGVQLLVGVTPSSIRTLHTYDEPVVDLSNSPAVDFASLLKRSARKVPDIEAAKGSATKGPESS